MAGESSSLPAHGCVLAGGAGRRLGGSKPSVALAGRPLISYPLEALRAAGLDPAVVAKPSTQLPELDIEIWREPPDPQHPLAGIVEGLRRAGGPILACGCDLPFVTAELAGWIVAQPEPLVVPEVDGTLQPLFARYGAEMLEPLATALEGQPSLVEVVQGLGPRLVVGAELERFGDPGRLLMNVNDFRDLERAETLLRA